MDSVHQNPVSCPRCKRYSLSKTRQPWPEGYMEFNLSQFDLKNSDPERITEQEGIDRYLRIQKRMIFEVIFKEWSKEFKERERKERITMIINIFKKSFKLVLMIEECSF
jgi:hypothetical protein